MKDDNDDDDSINCRCACVVCVSGREDGECFLLFIYIYFVVVCAGYSRRLVVFIDFAVIYCLSLSKRDNYFLIPYLFLSYFKLF